MKEHLRQHNQEETFNRRKQELEKMADREIGAIRQSLQQKIDEEKRKTEDLIAKLSKYSKNIDQEKMRRSSEDIVNSLRRIYDRQVEVAIRHLGHSIGSLYRECYPNRRHIATDFELGKKNLPSKNENSVTPGHTKKAEALYEQTADEKIADELNKIHKKFKDAGHDPYTESISLINPKKEE